MTAIHKPAPSAVGAPDVAEFVRQDAQNFSLVLGGPLFQFFRRAHLSDDALLLMRQRVVVISLVAWLPLLALSALEGTVWSGVAVPFVMDADVHVRFLIALPLLVIAELVVHQRMRPIARTFLERNLIPAASLGRFDDAIRAAFRLRNSTVAELLLIAFVYGIGVLVVWRQYTSLQTATWYGMPTAEGIRWSLAGTWYGYVSLPIFQFLLVRWYFRLFIWARFLWQVARIDLALVPTHPDRLGGLGFLSGMVHAFAVLGLAHGALVAGQLANRIFFLGAALTDFKAEIGLVAVFLLCVVFGPLLAFSSQLAACKRRGLLEYGTLAGRYAREFDAKWQRGGAPDGEALLGSADIQSLADMNNSYETVREMRLAPITRDAVVRLAATLLLPIAPLALTMMPLEELVRMLFGILF